MGETLEKLEGGKVAFLAFPHLCESSHYIMPMAVLNCLWEKWEVLNKGNTNSSRRASTYLKVDVSCQENACLPQFSLCSMYVKKEKKSFSLKNSFYQPYFTEPPPQIEQVLCWIPASMSHSSPATSIQRKAGKGLKLKSAHKVHDEHTSQRRYGRYKSKACLLPSIHYSAASWKGLRGIQKSRLSVKPDI